MYSVLKGAADRLLQQVSASLPPWQAYEAEQTFPARAPYQPTPPANVAMLPPALVQQLTTTVHFPPHHIYRLRQVHVTWDGAVFHNLRLFVPSIVHPRFARRFQDTLLLRQWVGERVHLPDTCVAVCHDQWSVENYYHWLVDTLPRLLVLRQHHPGMRLLLPQPLPPKQLPDYITRTAAIFGFTDYLPLTTRQILRAGCVVLPELTAPSLSQNPELMRQVRQELLAALAPHPVAPTRRIYAARATTGVRKLANEAEVDAVLYGLGFEKVYFEHLTFLEQVALMQQTTIFLGVHGAGMTNMLFLQGGARVVELLNAENGDPCYLRLASCLGLAYVCVPCKGTSAELTNQSDLVVEVTLVQQIVADLSPDSR